MKPVPEHRRVPDRARTIAGMLAEFRAFANLIDGLDYVAWTQPSRCEGWQVRDVAGHVVGVVTDVAEGAFGRRTPDQQAADLRDTAPSDLAATLRAVADQQENVLAHVTDEMWLSPSGATGYTIGQGIHGLLQDTYVHGDDIRTALGAASDRGPAMYASIDYVLGVLSRRNFAVTEPSSAAWLSLPSTSIPAATGVDALQFLLAATGREDPEPLGLPAMISIFR